MEVGVEVGSCLGLLTTDGFGLKTTETGVGVGIIGNCWEGEGDELGVGDGVGERFGEGDGDREGLGEGVAGV